MIRSLTWLACLLVAPLAAAAPPATPLPPEPLPARMQHHRFFIDAQAPSGQVLHLFTDTGGGMNLTTSGADKLGIAYEAKPGEQLAGTTPWPRYAGAGIPPPKSAPPDMTLPILSPQQGLTFDGMLGASWFGGRTWEWDYRAGTLRQLPDGQLPKADPAHVVKLGFQRGDDGGHTTHFPRIPARVDGEELQFLFDTGATFRLDEAAAARLGDAAVRERAGNFITQEVMQRWRERHPDWPTIDKGDAGMAMIQVPAVEVAGYRTGPAWFSARPDAAFHEYMAQWMDRPVDGALGGEAFRGFRITVDYPAETAVFEQ
ncbi:hypothetical protein ACTJIL_01705 [Luteimonas sp. 22616]|uniref:hypothetical protein n=1 Tax=Luteimonas sp. 22616 TaxID=3453951 RepID=UPI003F82BEFA